MPDFLLTGESVERISTMLRDFDRRLRLFEQPGSFGGRRPPQPIRIGKTTVAHNKGTSQTVDVYEGTTKGSETAISGGAVSAYNRFADLATGKWVLLVFVNGGYDLVAAEC